MDVYNTLLDVHGLTQALDAFVAKGLVFLDDSARAAGYELSDAAPAPALLYAGSQPPMRLRDFVSQAVLAYMDTIVERMLGLVTKGPESLWSWQSTARPAAPHRAGLARGSFDALLAHARALPDAPGDAGTQIVGVARCFLVRHANVLAGSLCERYLVLQSMHRALLSMPEAPAAARRLADSLQAACAEAEAVLEGTVFARGSTQDNLRLVAWPAREHEARGTYASAYQPLSNKLTRHAQGLVEAALLVRSVWQAGAAGWAAQAPPGTPRLPALEAHLPGRPETRVAARFLEACGLRSAAAPRAAPDEPPAKRRRTEASPGTSEPQAALDVLWVLAGCSQLAEYLVHPRPAPGAAPQVLLGWLTDVRDHPLVEMTAAAVLRTLVFGEKLEAGVELGALVHVGTEQTVALPLVLTAAQEQIGAHPPRRLVDFLGWLATQIGAPGLWAAVRRLAGGVAVVCAGWARIQTSTASTRPPPTSTELARRLVGWWATAAAAADAQDPVVLLVMRAARGQVDHEFTMGLVRAVTGAA